MASSLDIALTFIPLAPGALSILGASAILYNILSDPDRRFKTPYFRIMLGLSVADISYAIAKMFSTFVAPKNTPGLYFSSGNRATCNAQGFFLILGMIQPLYVACLSIKYLMVIKYSKTDKYLTKTIEPWMHLLSLGYPLLGAIVCVSLGSINSTRNQCYIGAYPMYCDDVQNGITCTRGQHAYLLHWIFCGSVICGALIVVTLCMLQVVLFVRKRWIVMKYQFTFQNHIISSCTNLENQYRAATKQALMYVGVFIVVWVFRFIFRVCRNCQNEHLLIPAQILNPLQGFFNFFIYTWPRHSKSKEENPSKSFWWLLKDSIMTTSRTKRTRRLNKRRSKIRASTTRKVESLCQSRAGVGTMNQHSHMFASPLEIVDDNVHDEEPITKLQILQGLDSPNEDFDARTMPIDLVLNNIPTDEHI